MPGARPLNHSGKRRRQPPRCDILRRAAALERFIERERLLELGHAVAKEPVSAEIVDASDAAIARVRR